MAGAASEDVSNRWSAEQRGNANVIIQVGLKMGMSWRDIQIGLMTAMTESSLRNLSYGDRDSAGLFQQRPSQGWGTFDQVTDPRYAAQKFFSTLRGVKNRGSMSLGEAAQAVQRSAFPDRYQSFMTQAMGFIQNAQKSGVKIAPGQTPTINPADLIPDATDTPMGGSAHDALGAATPIGEGGAPGLAAASPMGAQAAGAGATSDMSMFTDMAPFANQADYQNTFGNAPYNQKGVDGTRRALTEYARQFVGTPYVWGGNSLDSGVDCSGLIQQVFKHFGINLPRVSYEQVSSGTRVGLKHLRPGDLVGWDENSRNPGADHVALYLGHGQIIEAPRPGLGVRIRRLDYNGYDQNAWGSRLSY